MRKANYLRKTRQETLEQVFEYVSGVGVMVSMTEIGRGINPPIKRSKYLKEILDELVDNGWIKKVWHSWNHEIQGWLYYYECFEAREDEERQLSFDDLFESQLAND